MLAGETAKTNKPRLLPLFALTLASPPAMAGKSKAAQEAAEFVARTFGREAARDGASCARKPCGTSFHESE
jgi:hypothetical protein